MGRGIVKLTEDAFVEWSSICDAPATFVLSRADASAAFGEERVGRASANGTSYLDRGGEPDLSPAAFNRAGPHEERLSVQEMLLRYSKDKAVRDEFDARFEAHPLRWLRGILGFDLTLPKAPYDLLDALFPDPAALAPLEYSEDLVPHDWMGCGGGSAFRNTSEAILAILLLKAGKTTSDVDLNSFYSGGPENGRLPGFKLVETYVELAGLPGDSEGGVDIRDPKAPGAPARPERSSDRDIRLIRGVLEKWA